MTNDEFDRLVAGFYQAAAGTKDWRLALDEVATALGSWCIQIMGVDKRTGGLNFSHYGGKASPATSLDYLLRYHSLDPRARLMMTYAPGDWMHCHEHFDDRFVAEDAFYQSFLIPHGGRYVSGVKVHEDADYVVILGAHRDSESGPFMDQDRAALERLAGHLREAVALYRHLRAAFEEAGAGRELLDKFAYPMLLVDELGGIRFRNIAARTELQSGDYATDRGGVLTCTDPASQREFVAALQDLGLQGESRASVDSQGRCFLRIKRTSNTTAVIANLVAIRPQATMSAFGQSQAALVLLHDPSARRPLDPFLVAELFGLTPAEARVAVQLRTGLSPKRIAVSNRLSVATVRSQIQTTFSKMGVNRQVDLIRVLESIAGFETISSGRIDSLPQ